MDNSKSESSRKPSARPNVWIGTSGFSYDDWVGPYYPPGTKRSDFFDYYVADFDCLEINVSYYTWLSAQAVKSLVSRAPASFRFSAKLHRSITHDKGDIEHGIWATKEQNKPFSEEPFLLAQFPHRFAPTPDNWDAVKKLADGLSNLVIEFRNSEWQDAEAIASLSGLGVSVCLVDEPRLPGLMQFSPTLTGDIAYMRFHGRNAKQWYNHDKPHERYDYRYSREELSKFAQPILDMSEKARDTLVFFNNHYGAQAVDNARELANMLGVGKKPRQGKLF